MTYMETKPLTERQAQFLALFDGTRTHREVAKEAGVQMSSVTNRFTELRRAGYRPKVKSITYDRRMDEAGKAKAQDARIRRVLEMFWHRSRKCYVPHTSDALDERAGADSDLRLLMARRGLISSNAMKLVVYEITDAGRAWLEAQG